MKVMKKGRILVFVLIVMILSLTLTACNASSGKDSYNSAPSIDKGEGYYGSDGEGSGIGSLPSGGIDNPAAKIIKIADASVKTLDYDAFIESVYAKITELGGYTDGETFRGSTPSRAASITVRIPADKLDAFKSALGDIGTLTYYSAKKLDVSLEYATLTARIDTLTLEIGVVEELFEIAKNKGDLGSISSLEGRLSSLKLELAEARAEIAVYDNSISYSTVNLTVNEYKEAEEPEPEVKKGAFARIGENLVTNFKDIGSFFVELFVFLVSALPYLLLIGGVVTGIVFITIAVKKRKK